MPILMKDCTLSAIRSSSLMVAVALSSAVMVYMMASEPNSLVLDPFSFSSV
jgi:hypothetical protein